MDTLLDAYPVWDRLISMLRPMDIISLAQATGHKLEKEFKEMEWWRQIFYNVQWAEQGEIITIIGKDLLRLQNAIKACEYFDANDIKLLVIVQELEDHKGNERTVESYAGNALLASIDMPYMANTNCQVVEWPGPLPANICVIFFDHRPLTTPISVDFCFSWGDDLLERLPVLYPPPNGVALDPWFQAWYIRLARDRRLSNVLIEWTRTQSFLSLACSELP